MFFFVCLDDHFDISCLVAVCLLFIYLIFGTIIFFLSEEWSLVECFYFVYISLTTIGFGDYVPQVAKHLKKIHVKWAKYVSFFIL